MLTTIGLAVAALAFTAGGAYQQAAFELRNGGLFALGLAHTALGSFLLLDALK